MTNTKKKLLKQIGSLALCLCMILSCLPISAFAESQDGTCEHHHEHTAECGYVAAVEGQLCTHECGEECAEGCVHEHDDTCGYVAAAEGSPCQYECNEAHGEEETTESTKTSAPAYTAEDVKAMIDALPSVSEMESMSEDELNSVYEQAQEAYNAFETLTDEEQVELANDLEKLSTILEWFFPADPYYYPVGKYKGFEIDAYSGSIDDVTSISITQAVVIDSKLTIKFDFVHSGNTYSKTYTTTEYSCTQKFDYRKCNYSGDGFSVIFRIRRDAGHYVTTWTSAGSTQHTGICEIRGETVTENHTGNATCSATAPCSKCGENYINSDNHKILDNGICGCGKTYQEATLNNGVYEISNLGQLRWFAEKVNNGETAISGKLMNDIDATSIGYIGIGKDASHAFAGTFDGNNKTLKIALVSTEQYVAPFLHIGGATIKNLTVSGTIKTTHKFAAGIVGRVESGNAKLENCLSFVAIDSTNYTGSDGTHGGLLAVAGEDSTTTINNCGFAGSIIGTTTTSCGGIVGWAGSTVKISNSFVAAKFELQNNSGDTFARNQSKVTVTNCYYLNALSDEIYNGATKATAEQFKSGEVAYKLNNGKTDGTQVWYQTCQSDSYPKFSGETVYMGYICGSGDSNPVYRNSMDGLISVSSPEHSWKDGVCTNCGTTQAATWDETEKVYKIYNLVQLQWFADKVNAGETAINGKLMADIDASTLTSLAIGVNGKAYSGTFNGNGYTLTIGLNSTAQYAAPFQYVNGATIKNLTVTGTINISNQFAASIVGNSTGNTTIENCLSKVVIESTRSGDGTHGGLVANVSSGTMTINNCGFVGAINGSDTTNCGGLVGWANSTTNISNSFVAATFALKSGNNYTFSRNADKVSLTNCYYLNVLGEKQGTQMTADQFSNGEVAWLLNGSDNGVWKQTIGTDSYPNFSGKVVYKITPCEVGYTNNEAEKTEEHNYNDLNSCTVCGKLKLNADGYYEIDTIEKLLYFAQRVNAGEYEINAKLMANLDLNGQPWTPIAYLAMSDLATVGYSGIFDGNGHVISNITIITPTSATANGFFGIITTGTVKNLGIDGLTFDNNDHDHRAGGIAGQLMSGGTIENCFVINSTIKASSRVVGGIVGLCKGAVKNCYTANLTLAGHANRFGGITGDYKGGSIVNCYTDHAALGSTADSVGTKDKQSQTSVTEASFASGTIAWLLNGSKSDGIWKQTIGVHSYPCFNGNDVNLNADSYEDSAEEVSLQIIWTSMEFTYFAGEWDPTTHTYTGEGYWSSNVAGGNVITMKNMGVTVDIALSYESLLDGVSGNFDVVNTTIEKNEGFASALTILGTPSGTNFADKQIGTINIQIKKTKITTTTWNVGDTVDWYGDDGKLYTCQVVSKNDNGYVLATTDYVKTMSGSFDDMASDAATVGARLPNTDDSAERAFVQSKISKATDKFIAVCNPSKYGNVGYFWNDWASNYGHLTSPKYTFQIYYVFDVPIQ